MSQIVLDCLNSQRSRRLDIRVHHSKRAHHCSSNSGRWHYCSHPVSPAPSANRAWRRQYGGKTGVEPDRVRGHTREEHVSGKERGRSNRERDRSGNFAKLSMSVRTTSRNVTFRRAFSLQGVDGMQPRGTYDPADLESALARDLQTEDT
jgi:hypothetical protein